MASVPTVDLVLLCEFSPDYGVFISRFDKEGKHRTWIEDAGEIYNNTNLNRTDYQQLLEVFANTQWTDSTIEVQI